MTARSPAGVVLALLLVVNSVQGLSAQGVVAPATELRLGGSPVSSGAGLQQDQSGRSSQSAYDRIWQFANWYENESNPVVQRVLFSGRFQYEFANVSADQGDHDEWNIRRLRLGPRITLYRTVTFHSEVELNPQERDPTYVRFTDFYVQWAPISGLAVTVGKQGAPFTVDGATSSKELLTIDRSNLSNNLWFPQEYVPGVSVSGARQQWVYRVGVYSSGAANREFGEFDGGVFTLASLGYDFAESLGVEEALLTGNYVYQTEDPRNTFTRQLQHVGSVNVKVELDRWGVRGDVSAAQGHEPQGDLLGLMAMPFFNATNQLQFVARYTFLNGSNGDSVRLAAYESRVVPRRGDRYHEVYLGGSYYFYGHKLKLQSGVQFAELGAQDEDRYSGVSWTTGLRVSW